MNRKNQYKKPSLKINEFISSTDSNSLNLLSALQTGNAYTGVKTVNKMDLHS